MKNSNEELSAWRTIPIARVALDLGLNQVGGGGGRYVEFRGDGQKMVVNAEKNVFFCNEEAVGGGVIDLVMLQKGFSLGLARAWLRKNYRDDSSARPPQPSPTQARTIPNFKPAGDAAMAYLQGRGLADDVILSAIRQDAVREVRQNGYTNTVLTHLDAAGLLCGGEVRGKGFKSFAGSKTGLFRLRSGNGRVDLVVVVESGVDALAYAQLFRSFDAVVVSTSGTPASAQREALSALLSEHPAADLVAGQDADEGGDRQAGKIEELAAAAGRDYVRHRPEGVKDWTELLPAN